MTAADDHEDYDNRRLALMAYRTVLAAMTGDGHGVGMTANEYLPCTRCTMGVIVCLAGMVADFGTRLYDDDPAQAIASLEESIAEMLDEQEDS